MYCWWEGGGSKCVRALPFLEWEIGAYEYVRQGIDPKY